MTRRVVGLDINAVSVKCAQVMRQGRSRLATKLATVGLPPGTVADGKVLDPKALIAGLDSLIVENEISGSVILGLRGSQVTVKTRNYPAMPRRELEQAVRFEIPELVAFPAQSLEEITYDYFITRELGHGTEVVVVAAPRYQIDPYLEVIKSVGLKLTAIDLAPLGWVQLFAERRRRALLEIGEEQTIILVVIGNVFKILRTLPLGAAHFREGVREAFGFLEENGQLLYYKHDLDYLLREGRRDPAMLRTVLQQFVDLILQTLDFVRAQERASQFTGFLDELIVLGDLADVRKLDLVLEEEIGLPTKSLKRLDSLREGLEAIRPGRFNCYGSALSLGLRGLDV